MAAFIDAFTTNLNGNWEQGEHASEAIIQIYLSV